MAAAAEQLDMVKVRDALLRRDLSAFTQRAFTTVDPGAEYLHNYHIDLIADYLMACWGGDIRRLVINEPPRYAKSTSCTVAFPAWGLGHDPTQKFVAASYKHDLAKSHSLKTRQVMQSDWYRHIFPGTTLSRDQNESTKFKTTRNGHRICGSVSGGITGEGGNFIIFDDPHNPLEALSDVQRKKGIDFYRQSLYSRLDNKRKGVIIVVMQRLHEGDLSGVLLDEGGWEHLDLQARAEKKTIIDFGRFTDDPSKCDPLPPRGPIIREIGDVLHPEREDDFILSETEVQMGDYAFAGQYQQRPTPLGGGFLKPKWCPRYQQLPPRHEWGRIVHSWDTAQKPSDLNAYSVCGTFIEHVMKAPGEKTRTVWYLVDVWRDRVIQPALVEKAVEIYERQRHDKQMRASTVLIEDKSSGQGLIQELQSVDQTSPVTGDLVHLPVEPIEPVLDKLTRAVNASPYIKAGNIWLPAQAPWLSDFENEMKLFPNATFLDQVDMLSQMINWAFINAGGFGFVTSGNREERRPQEPRNEERRARTTAQPRPRSSGPAGF